MGKYCDTILQLPSSVSTQRIEGKLKLEWAKMTACRGYTEYSLRLDLLFPSCKTKYVKNPEKSPKRSPNEAHT